MSFRFAILSVVAASCAACASAQIAVSANDNKVLMDNGVIRIQVNPAPDTVAVIDLASSPPKVLAEIEVSASVVGPPVSVAISKDAHFALVTSAQKYDPADKTKTIPDNKVAIIDLQASPPRVVGTVEAGAGAAGVSFTPSGDLALVANRSEGTVSVFKVAGSTLTKIDTLSLGAKDSGPSHVTVAPDGKMALVTRDNDGTVSVLEIEGDKVTYNKRDMAGGVRPYTIAITPDGKSAVVGHVGRGLGDVDTVGLIDLAAKPPRYVDSVPVGQQPEGVMVSPDGKFAIATVLNGTNKPKDSPFYNTNCKIVALRIDGATLRKVSEVQAGAWCQGSAFSQDGKTVIVQSMMDKALLVLSITPDGQLKDTGVRLPMKGGPAGLRSAGGA